MKLHRLRFIVLAGAIIGASCFPNPSSPAPIKDDHKSYYGPIVRKRADLPIDIGRALCGSVALTRCLADPNQDWSDCGDMCPGRTTGPDSQLIWARRMGQDFVVYRNVNGFNISVEFVVLKTGVGGFRQAWTFRSEKYGIIQPAKNIDPRIWSVIRHVFTDRNPCNSKSGMANNSPDCAATHRWPYH